MTEYNWKEIKYSITIHKREPNNDDLFDMLTDRFVPSQLWTTIAYNEDKEDR